MQITLDDTDLERMPLALRRDLLRFLALPEHGGAVAAPGEPPKSGAAVSPLPLDRTLALELLREASFGAGGEIDAAAGQALVRRLGLAGERQLRAYLGLLTRRLERATGDPSARLFTLRPEPRAYVVPAETRRVLAELLRELSRAGEHEEPLWE